MFAHAADRSKRARTHDCTTISPIAIVSCVQGRSDGVVVLSVPRGVSHRCTPPQWRPTHVVRLTRAKSENRGPWCAH